MTDLGPLALALAKAQSDFPAVVKDKTVSTGKYSYSYAPLDSILKAVRQPLADNGLVVVQILDDGALVTSLIHESGAILSGSIDIPTGDNIQALGSAITYLRRYSIQAMLGIAAEDDDDGKQAVGNRVSPRRQDEPPREPGPAERRTTHADGLIGKAIAQGTQDFNLRESPDGYSLPFRIKEGKLSQIAVAKDNIALALAASRDEVIDQRVTVWGYYEDQVFDKPNGDTITYKVLHVERIKTPAFEMPAPAETPPAGFVSGELDEADEALRSVEAESIPWEPLTDDEKAAIAGSLPG